MTHPNTWWVFRIRFLQWTDFPMVVLFIIFAGWPDLIWHGGLCALGTQASCSLKCPDCALRWHKVEMVANLSKSSTTTRSCCSEPGESWGWFPCSSRQHLPQVVISKDLVDYVLQVAQKSFLTTTWRSRTQPWSCCVLFEWDLRAPGGLSVCWAEEEAETVSVSKGRFALDFSKTLCTNSVLLQITEEGEDPFQDSL